VSSSSKDKKKSNHFLETMFKESDAYSSMELIESLVEKGVGLASIPLQPLYLALKNLPVEQAATHLDKFTPEQRELMLDLDLWNKDELDPEEFEFWVETYSHCLVDEVRAEFVQSIEFLLYLKGRFNIWTFDVEDPQYPDHDCYFLTDDSLLLFEFNEDYHLVDHVRSLIREIYSYLGVEKAYSWLFKMVSEEVSSTLEDEYQLKKGRLADAGFVDYYDALEIDNPHINLQVMDNWLRKKEILSVGVHSFSKQQILPKKALVPFEKQFESFDDELSKIKEDKRREYLQFNFLRLVNGTMALNGSFKDGGVAINRAGEKTKAMLQLGFSYLTDYFFKDGANGYNGELSLFDRFDFTEVFRIGRSLMAFGQKDLKKALRLGQLDDDESFYGQLISDFLDQSFDRPPKVSESWNSTPANVDHYSLYIRWRDKVDFFCELNPYINKLFSTFLPLRTSGQIQDSFYFNYNVADIDFEAILISSFSNFVLVQKGKLNKDTWDQGKLGLTISEFKEFIKIVLTQGMELNWKNCEKDFNQYKDIFGLNQVPFLNEYMKELLEIQLEGYEYLALSEEEFAHVGGPILLRPASQMH
jgi:hypothetical protein